MSDMELNLYPAIARYELIGLGYLTCPSSLLTPHTPD